METVQLTGYDVGELRRLAEVEVEQNSGAPGKFRAYTLRELYEVEQQPLLVEQLFSPGHHGMFYGPPGAGKTFAIADMAVRGAHGLHVFGKLAVERPFKTLVCAAEGSIDKLASRFVTAAAHHGLEINSDMIRLIPDVPALFAPTSSDSGLGAFLDALDHLQQNRFGPDLIVFDTQSDLVIGGDDNSNADASVVLANLRTIREQSGAATANIHHPTKDGAHYRGAAVWRQKCDFIVEIIGSDNPRQIRCDKLKDGERFKPIAGKLISVPDPRYPGDLKRTSAVFEWLPEAPSQSSPKEQRLRNKAKVIAQLREDHAGAGSDRNPPPNAGSYPTIAKAIGLSPNTVQKVLNELADDQATGVRRGKIRGGAVYWWDERWRDEEF